MNSENLNNKHWRQEKDNNVKKTSIIEVIDFEQMIIYIYTYIYNKRQVRRPIGSKKKSNFLC